MENRYVIYRYDIITDPDDPQVRESIDNLLSLVENNNNFILTETILYNGLVRYNIDIVYDRNTSRDTVNKVDQLSGEINYSPITVSLDISRFGKEDIIGPIISGASEIIKIITEKMLAVEITTVENIRRDNIVIFNPISSNGTSVYENPSYLYEYYSTVNMDLLRGYRVLSRDPIVRYALKYLYDKGEYNPEDIKTISVSGIILLPVGYNDKEQDHYNKIVDRVESLVTKFREDGYFSIEIGIHNIADISLIKELATLWNTEIVYDEDMEYLILKHNQVDFGTSPSLWYQSNIDVIKKGEIPYITLYGEWQFKIGGDYNKVYGKPWNYAIINYGGLLAYQKLGREDPFIQPFTHTVIVNNDLSITISVPTYNHALKFREYFEEIINGYYDMDKEHYWYAEPCKDLIDGVIKRWYIQSIDKRSMPMILKQTYPDGKYEEILLYRSPAVALYYKDNPLDFDNVDMDRVKNDFMEMLKEHYKVCHNGIEPILLDKIDGMSLTELLDLVEVTEGKNGPTYCYSHTTLLKLDPPISPMTRQPLHDHILIKAMMIEWGLRGLFNIGSLLGLYEDVPKKILVKPLAGTPFLNKEEIEPIRRTITGDIYNILIAFDDGTVTDLFDIATDNINELKKLVNELWFSGFFLSYWSSAVQKYSVTINNFPAIISNLLLLYAADSKADGERALNYLKVSSRHL
jgi:hypothetical protein